MAPPMEPLTMAAVGTPVDVMGLSVAERADARIPDVRAAGIAAVVDVDGGV